MPNTSKTKTPPSQSSNSVPLTRFPADVAVLPEILSHVAKSCATAKLESNLSLHIELTVEELFTNTTNYGQKEEGNADVWVAVCVDNKTSDSQTVRLVYHDSGPPFNPFVGLKLPFSGKIQNKPIGSIGTALVIGLTTQAHYRRENDRNVMEFELISNLSDVKDGEKND